MHGMQEVVGSIPIGSTKNHLKNQTLSLTFYLNTIFNSPEIIGFSGNSCKLLGKFPQGFCNFIEVSMDLESHKALKKYGEEAGRERLALRIIEICKTVAESENYKEAINAAGRMYALAIACKADDYWAEKMTIGFDLERLRAQIELDDFGKNPSSRS